MALPAPRCAYRVPQNH